MGFLRKLYNRIVYKAGRTDRYWRYYRNYLKGGIMRHYWQYKLIKIELACCASIPHTEKIQRFTTPHGLDGIHISMAAVIGSGCTIFHQVTIGSNTLKGSKRPGAPVIGDNVYIGAGAKIIGGITVGSNVRIGANCVVTEDVPDNCTVVLGKPRVITHDAPPDNSFVAFGDF